MNKAILVTGSHRSGTTWIGKTIAASEKVLYIQEPFNIGIEQYESPLTQWFQYINEQSDPAFQKKVNYYLRTFGGLPPKHVMKKLFSIRSPRKAYGFVTYVKNRLIRRPLFKDPIAFFSSEWFASTIDTDVIVSIRHPAAFVASLKVKNWTYDFSNYYRQTSLMENVLDEYKEEIELYTSEKQDIIKQGILLYNTIYATSIRFQKLHPEWYFVRHEDLSRNPTVEFKKVFDHLNIPFTDKVQKAILESTQATQSSKLKRDSVSNIKSWKDRLSQGEIELIKNRTENIWKHNYTEDEW